jgi:hypothetical protein
MSDVPEQVERTQAQAIQAPFFKEVSRIPGSAPGTGGTPKVVIKGDIRLRVTESYAALRPVKGHYRIETENMQEPLHVIWIIEGNVLNHPVHSIDVAFDMRGTPAGETLTRVLTAQVAERNGQGCIVHSSVFVQICVMRDDLPMRDPVLNQTSF